MFFKEVIVILSYMCFCSRNTPTYLPTYLPTYIYARQNTSKFVNMSNPVQLSSKKMKEYQAALPEGFHEGNEKESVFWSAVGQILV